MLAPVLAGCGLVHNGGTNAVSVTITRNFGAKPLAARTQSHVSGSETVLELLEKTFPVRVAGTQVVAIDGVTASPGSHWFMWINGSASGIGTSRLRTVVHAGDRIWWDLHRYAATRSVPVVVGSFPEPFVHGLGGKRLPVTLECASDVTTACDRVASALGKIGVPAPRQLIGTGSGTSTLGVVVGTWSEVQGEIAALLIAAGPGRGGIYAHFTGRHGGTLQLLDASGHVARILGPSAGLIAATGDVKSVPTWFVTGTDVAGVTAAASAVSVAQLRDHLALAVQGAQDLPVPQP